MDATTSKTELKNHCLHIFLIILFGLYIFLRSDPYRISVEKNIYDYYAESIVKDHDLNVINQVPEKERWQITRSGNYPDMHSNGIVSFWSPFFIYKNLIDTDIPLEDREAIFLTRTMATCFFALVSIVLILYWVKKELKFVNSNKDLIIYVLGSSFLWYSIFQPGNADITSLAVALLELIFFRKILKENLPIQYFLFGLLLSIGLTLKIDHFFFLLLPLYLFFNQIKNRTSWKKTRLTILLFTAGYLINLIPMIVNDTIKFGYIDYGYRGVLTSDYYLLWGNLFYPSGFLTNNPIFIFSFVGLILMFFEKERQNELIVIGMIPVVSLLIESFARLHQESYGGRHWIAYLPCLLMLYLYTFKKINSFNINIWIKRFIYLLPLMTIIQNLSKLLQMNLNYKKFFLGINQYQSMLIFFQEQDLVSFLGMVFNYPLLSIKMTYFLPLIIMSIGCTSMLYWYYVIKKNNILNLIVTVTIFTTVSYLIMTSLNLLNNHKNFLAFKETSLLDNAIVGDGPHIHSLFENLGTTEKALSFYVYRQDSEKIKFFEKIRADYIRLASLEIIHDPVGFKSKMENANLNFINDELRTD